MPPAQTPRAGRRACASQAARERAAASAEASTAMLDVPHRRGAARRRSGAEGGVTRRARPVRPKEMFVFDLSPSRASRMPRRGRRPFRRGRGRARECRHFATAARACLAPSRRVRARGRRFVSSASSFAAPPRPARAPAGASKRGFAPVARAWLARAGRPSIGSTRTHLRRERRLDARGVEGAGGPGFDRRGDSSARRVSGPIGGRRLTSLAVATCDDDQEGVCTRRRARGRRRPNERRSRRVRDTAERSFVFKKTHSASAAPMCPRSRLRPTDMIFTI